MLNPNERDVRCRDRTKKIKIEGCSLFFITGCTSANLHDGMMKIGADTGSIYYMLVKAWKAGW